MWEAKGKGPTFKKLMRVGKEWADVCGNRGGLLPFFFLPAAGHQFGIIQSDYTTVRHDLAFHRLLEGHPYVALLCQAGETLNRAIAFGDRLDPELIAFSSRVEFLEKWASRQN